MIRIKHSEPKKTNGGAKLKEKHIDMSTETGVELN